MDHPKGFVSRETKGSRAGKKRVTWEEALVYVDGVVAREREAGTFTVAGPEQTAAIRRLLRLGKFQHNAVRIEVPTAPARRSNGKVVD